MRSRTLRLMRGLGLLLAAGLAYAAFCLVTGWSIPCPFHLLTGWNCPGCGVTRMCLALLRLDLAGAWQANPGLMLLLPFLAVLLLSLAVRYIRTGRGLPSPGEQKLIWCGVAYLLLYGLLRNLWGI